MEASDSGVRTVGDYIVGYSIKDAEVYHLRNGSLEWQEPVDENCHLEIVVRDASDGRFLPGLTMFATLHEANGSQIGSYPIPFLWHPWIYHYGRERKPKP
jgi:hypothetical protein